MAYSSILNIVADPSQGAATLCGLPNPTSAVSTTDANAPILLRLANQVGRELARRHDWQGLKVDFTFVTLAAEAQTALPTDFDHFVSNVEMWNRSLNLRYSFPTDDQVWGRVKGLAITSGAPGWARLLGGTLYITPAPTAGQTVALPYISQNWVHPTSGSNKAAFTLDTDVPLIPDYLLTLGIVWAYKSNKGFDYAEFMSTYEREIERATSRDRGLKVIGLRSGRYDDPILTNTWPGIIS